MPSEEAMHKAAQCWCDPRTEKTQMDVELATVFAETLDKNLTPAKAVSILSIAFRNDPAYAWSWHCNIAMAYVDAGGDHKTANEAARRFMKQAFNAVDYEPVRYKE